MDVAPPLEKVKRHVFFILWQNKTEQNVPHFVWFLLSHRCAGVLSLFSVCRPLSFELYNKPQWVENTGSESRVLNWKWNLCESCSCSVCISKCETNIKPQSVSWFTSACATTCNIIHYTCVNSASQQIWFSEYTYSRWQCMCYTTGFSIDNFMHYIQVLIFNELYSLSETLR